MILTLKKDWPEKGLVTGDKVEFIDLYTWWYATVKINGSIQNDFPIQSVKEYFEEAYCPEDIWERLANPL